MNAYKSLNIHSWMLAIELRNIVKKYGKTVALKGSYLQIKCGEIYGLLGFNGAGKTITLKILAGLLTPDEGEAYVMGYNVQ